MALSEGRGRAASPADGDPAVSARSRATPVILLLLSGGFVALETADWVPALADVLGVLFVFVIPGAAWQSLRGRLSPTLPAVSLAVALSVGGTVGLGLGMNAMSIGLSRAHWADAVGGLVAALAAVDLVWRRSTIQIGSQRPAGRRWSWSGVAVLVVCLVVSGAAATTAWVSQQDWLHRQHYTELYAIAAGATERVTVHNVEGQFVTYHAQITANGAVPIDVSFGLASGQTWSRVIPVLSQRSGLRHPLLEVHLFRAGLQRVYRQLRLTRLQPSPILPAEATRS